MKKYSRLARLTSLLLTMLMVGSCFVALPLTASAETDLNKAPTVFEELDGPTWTIPDALPSGISITNAVDHGDFSLWKSSINLKSYADPTDSSKTVWGVNNSRSAIVLNDDEVTLSSYREFTYSVDLYFADFPTGTRTSNGVDYTPDQLTLSLLKLRAIKSGSSATTVSDISGVRVNSKGEMCDSTHKSVGVSLPEDTWFNLAVTFRPADGSMIVYLDGDKVYQSTFTAFSGFTKADLYLLDGYYESTAYVRNIAVSASNREYWIGATHANAAPPAVNTSHPDNVPADYGKYSLSTTTTNISQRTDPAGGTQKVWGLVNASGILNVIDDENTLVNAAAFTVETDMYFAAFPSGTRISGGLPYSPDELPLSLIKWQTVATEGGSATTSNALRVGSDGRLYTNTGAESATDVYLPQNEWFNIRLTVNPASGRFEVYLNGERVIVDSFSAQTVTYSSIIKFFDGYYKYSVYLKNPAIYTLDKGDIGITHENTADYFGYQTKAITNGTFDIRFLSSIDPAAFSATGAETSDTFAGAGYEVTAVWIDENGEVNSSIQRIDTETVYRVVNTESGDFTMPDGDYIHAFILRGVDATLERIEFVIRPYTDLRDGSRRYGSAAVLLWNGELDANGYPALSRIEQISSYKTKPSDDTFIRLISDTTQTDTGVNGESKGLFLKYLGEGSIYNRDAYLKFTFSETGIERVKDACRIILRVYSSVAPAESSWTQTEIDAGGVLGRFAGCSTDWDETALSTANNYPNDLPTLDGSEWNIVFRDDEWVEVDVTDYVKSCAENGCVAFLLELISTINTTVQFSSSESTSSPELVVYPALYNHEVDLDKYNNYGYEPWAYAEQLVSDWITEGYKNAYSAGDTQWHLDFDEMSSAADTSISADDLQLHLNFDEMTSATDTGNDSAYTITVGNAQKLVLTASPTDTDETVLGINDYRSKYVITDTADALLAKERFSFEADFYFADLPYGTRADTGDTPAENPLNLVRWMPASNASDNGVRINDQGELFTSHVPDAGSTGKSITEGKWFNLRIDFDLVQKNFVVYLDGTPIATKTFSYDMSQSVFYILDGYYQYTAYIKDIRIYGDAAPYTVAVGSTQKCVLTESPTNADETVLGINNYRSTYVITDTTNALLATDSFSMEADFYFASFPTGIRTSSGTDYTPAQLPLNLMRFTPRSGATNYGIRIDDRGELYYTSSASGKTGVFVPQNEWFNIRIDYDLANMCYTVYLNDTAVVTTTLSGEFNMSQIYLLDGYYQYTAYIKDVRIYNHGGYSTYNLEEIDNTKENGEYNYYSPWRHTQLKNLVQSKVYLRTVDSLDAKTSYDAASVVAPVYDQYGGISNAGFKGEATGYFHTEIIGGRTFIIDPLGNPYFAVGMNTVELGATDAQDEKTLGKYGDAETFYTQIVDELREIGINTVWGGDWEELIATEKVGTVIGISVIVKYMSSIRMNDTTGADKFKYNNTMNAFDPDFATYANKLVASTISGYTENPYVLGYTSDNEISAEANMLYRYLTIDPTEPANAFSYAAAWTFLKARTGKANPSTSDITPALSEEFKAFVYDRYFSVVTAAFDNAGAKQMYLGNRIHSDNRTSEGYLRAASQYVDVLTVNLYGGPQPPIDVVETIYKYSGKPIIVTEFYAKAQNTADMNGIPLMNATNAGWIVNSQEDRAVHYENYALRLIESRCCVGWTWYRFRDNDQRIYKDADNNIYIEHDVNNGRLDSYLKIGTLNADGTYNIDPDFLAVTTDLTVSGDPYLAFLAEEINADNVDQLLTVIHKGEHGGDQSNNNSNKGLYDNDMNIYEPLAESFRAVSENLLGLVEYFDALHAE